MTNISLPLYRPFLLKLPLAIRYLEKQYVENFFESGNIMLTTYSKCKTHENISRKDENEGKINFELTHGDRIVAGIQNVGFQSYMLCLSMRESDHLMKKFSTDCYFFIKDLLGFADAISRSIPGFDYMRIGFCMYRPQRLLSRTTATPIEPSPNALLEAALSGDSSRLENEFHATNHKLAQAINQELADEQYFIKEDSFSDEAEIRIIWTTSREVQGSLIVKCPEAVQFCSHGMPLSRSYELPKNLGDQSGSAITGYRDIPQ